MIYYLSGYIILAFVYLDFDIEEGAGDRVVAGPNFVHFVNKILIRFLIENLRKKTLNAIGFYLSIENVKIINSIYLKV